jgi:hypothetical protein
VSTSSAREEVSGTAEVCRAHPWQRPIGPQPSADRRWCGDGTEALAVSTRTTEAPAKGTGLVLLTLAAGQFLMTWTARS